MIGTLINVATIIIGGGLGVLLGARIPARLRQTVISGLGLFVLAYGIQMFLKTQNPLIVCGAVLIGVLLGEWWKVEDGLAWLGKFLEARFMRSNGQSDGRFVRAFLTSSLLFCIGPIAILGSIQDGLTGDYKLLAVKALMDGFAAMAFASTLGVGVIFSALPILVYQGGITLLAAQAQALITPAMMAELIATGGILLLGISVSSLLEIKPIRVGNFLPALLAAPLIVAALKLFGQ